MEKRRANRFLRDQGHTHQADVGNRAILAQGKLDRIENESPWQDGYSASLGDCHRNKLQVTTGIIRLSLSKQKEVRGPVFAGELLIDPIFLAKRKKPVSFKRFSSFPCNQGLGLGRRANGTGGIRTPGG